MKSRNLLIAAVLLAALSGVVYWTKKNPQSTNTSSTPQNPTLVAIPDSQIQSIDLKKKDSAALTLQKQNNKWVITSPERVATDQDAAGGVASALSSITADTVVEDKATDLNKFGLQNPSLTVTVHEKDGKTQNIYFGDDLPTGSLVYANVSGGAKVYSVFASTKTSFDKSVNDLRDKRLLTFDSNTLSRLELSSGKTDIEFGKNNQNDWTILKPASYRADNFQVEELLRKLTDAKMDAGTSDDAKKAEAAFDSGQPVGTAKVTDASGTQTLQTRKVKDDYYAKSSVVPRAYKVSSDLGKGMEKSLDDFRNKKIFDFGFSDPNKIDIQQGASAKALTRSGSDWKQNGQTMDAGLVQSFIDKVRDLSAAKFVTEGFTEPAAATVTVTSNDGKRTEKVEFAKVGDGYIARRTNEPTLYQLDAKAVKDMLDASNAIKPAQSTSKK